MFRFHREDKNGGDGICWLLAKPWNIESLSWKFLPKTYICWDSASVDPGLKSWASCWASFLSASQETSRHVFSSWAKKLFRLFSWFSPTHSKTRSLSNFSRLRYFSWTKIKSLHFLTFQSDLIFLVQSNSSMRISVCVFPTHEWIRKECGSHLAVPEPRLSVTAPAHPLKTLAL